MPFRNIQSRCTPTLFELILSAMPFPPISVLKMVYVNLGGNDSSGTGNPDAPFLTLNKAMDSITDATVDNPYFIFLASGVFKLTADLSVKPNVHIIGMACGAGDSFAVQIYGDHPPVQIDNNGFDFDLSNAAVDGDQFGFLGIHFVTDGTFTISHAGLCIRHCTWGSRAFIADNNSRGAYIESCTFYRADVYGPLNATFSDCIAKGDVRSFDNGPCDVTFNGCSLQNFLTQTDNGSIRNFIFIGTTVIDQFISGGDNQTISYPNGTFLPANYSVLSGNPTLIMLSDSTQDKYAPSTPADWAGTPPVNVGEALDRLAAVAPTPP